MKKLGKKLKWIKKLPNLIKSIKNFEKAELVKKFLPVMGFKPVPPARNTALSVRCDFSKKTFFLNLADRIFKLVPSSSN